MPTVILLDVSLAMADTVKADGHLVCSTVVGTRPEELDEAGVIQLRELALEGLTRLIDHIALTSKLEYISLIVYSSNWEVLSPFTRDYDALKTCLRGVRFYDRTCLDSALSAVGATVRESWGNTVSCQIVHITGTQIDPSEAPRILGKLESALPFTFESRLHLIALAKDPAAFQKCEVMAGVSRLHNNCKVYSPQGRELTPALSARMFTELIESGYQTFEGQMKCGNLSSWVQIFPPPQPFMQVSDCGEKEFTVSKDMQILGFLTHKEVANPPCISRHLVLPALNPGEIDEKVDKGRATSFAVLLHGALKVERMVAIAEVSPDWFGMFYSWAADSKKKSSLTLSLFRPGADSVPWLGSLHNLAPLSSLPALPGLPVGLDECGPKFPIQVLRKKSYSLGAQGSCTWLKSSGLQVDIQKIIRFARKIPEKQSYFYKELNRVRRAALSVGFVDLPQRLATLLEREKSTLPSSAHPMCAVHLQHVVEELRSETASDLYYVIDAVEGHS